MNLSKKEKLRRQAEAALRAKHVASIADHIDDVGTKQLIQAGAIVAFDPADQEILKVQV